MKVIFMGTPDFSVGTLEALIEAGHEVVLAVTQPDKPKGRGGKMQFPPVKETALKHGIPVYQPRKIREEECIEELEDLSGGYDGGGCFWSDPAQGDPGDDALRLHQCPCISASEISRSGAHPVGSDQRGEGIRRDHHADGRRAGYRRHAAEDRSSLWMTNETGGSLHDKLAAAGASLCVETLKGLEAGHESILKSREKAPRTYASMLKIRAWERLTGAGSGRRNRAR